MTEFKPGDRVRVTYEAIVRAHGDEGRVSYVTNEDESEASFVIHGSTVELIQPADDPSKDPVGTLRKGPNGELAVKSHVDDDQHWQTILPNTADVYYRDHEVVGWGVVGAVPGTPAAEAQRPREPWTGDGSEEPPAHVTKVRDCEGDTLFREGDKWRGDEAYHHDPRGWLMYKRSMHGPWTEVRA